ncbi:hypothetical protein BGZ60DRAFT_258407 [Tricladium varicosporioides]|nr:hypothetical protein BGZ60DRAFT_258407 [Hymenoscyphus varicosporioides]
MSLTAYLKSFPLTPSSIIFALSGSFQLINGALSLLSPAFIAQSQQNLNISSIPALHLIGLTSIANGAFYVNAACIRDRRIMYWSILGRAIGAATFAKNGGVWTTFAYFEAGMVVLTGLGLWFDERFGKEKGTDEVVGETVEKGKVA